MNKSAFFKLSYGLYVITSGKDGRFNGQIANTVFQVTSEPPTVAVSINKRNFTHEHIELSRRFVVSVLEEETPMTLIGQFGFKCGRDVDKFKAVGTRTGMTGVPIVTDHCVAFIEAEVTQKMDCATHTIFIGRVVDCDVLSSSAEPMTYAYYHMVKGGKSPKNAPTYQESALPNPSTAPFVKASRFTCSVCGYIYDPEKGDEERKVAAGTRFEDLSADWVCPACGAGKDEFVKER
jgi:flavin reductase (DIM6/NTAB) family NADH-FMN oxidoreductase RutF/rubredoxin